MNKANKAMVNLMVAAAMASGDIADSELKFIKKVGANLDIEEKALLEEIEKAKTTIDGLNNSEAYDNFIKKNASSLSEDERSFAFECIMGLLTTDGVFDIEETAVAGTIAKFLKLEADEIIGSVAVIVNANKKLEVTLDDED